MHFKYIFALLIFSNLACVPSAFKKQCTPNPNIEGTYQINDSTRFYRIIHKTKFNSPLYNLVKITKINDGYQFTLMQDDKVISEKLVNLKPTKSGAFKHPANFHFKSWILLSFIGGHNIYFGINKNKNLITKVSQGGVGFFLLIPIFPAVGENHFTEWPRVN